MIKVDEITDFYHKLDLDECQKIFMDFPVDSTALMTVVVRGRRRKKGVIAD